MIDDLQWLYQAAVHGPWTDLRGHLPYLRHAVTYPAHAVVIEAGVRRGMSTRAFLAGGAEVWSVDVAPADVPAAIRNHASWHFLQADDLSSQAQAWLPPECDVLFLDAHDDRWTVDQLRAHVLAELRAYMPRVRPGGIALLHDTQWQPPSTDLGEPVGGVALALNDYSAETGLAWENRGGFYGLGIMRKPA